MNKILTAIILAAFVTSSVVPSLSWAGESLEIITNDLETISVRNLTRVSVSDPEVADISDAQADTLTVIGKKPGQTAIFLWDDSGKRSVIVHVANQELSSTKAHIAKILDKAQINGVTLEENVEEGKIILSGSLPKDEKEALQGVVEPYNDQIINLVKELIEENLVQVDMQIAELSTSETKNLGILWGTSGDGDLSIKYPETIPGAKDDVSDLFRIGKFSRSTALQARINAIVENNKGRILSKPRLVVGSGKEASFLVGGEIPITGTSQNSQGTVQNVVFKKYGINLTVTPTIRTGDKINVTLSVEVSDIDGKRSGNDTAFITRTAQTELLLDNTQTIVLAGLIKHNDGVQVKGVPYLSKVPVVGALFRNRASDPNADTEMVIVLTPTILRDRKFAKTQMVMPGKNLRDIDQEISANYEQEPVVLNPTPEAPVAVPAKPALTPAVVPAVVPVAVAPVAAPTMPYTTQIQQKISQAASYPYEALENGWQGTVKLKLHILKDGTLATAAVLESSGHDVFDQDALNTAKIVAPYPSFPAEMAQEDLIVTVPIVYNKNVSLSKVNQAQKADTTIN